MSDTDIMLEDINGKFDAVLEAVTGIHQEIKGLAKQTDLEEVKADVKTIKATLTDHSGQLDEQDKRINQLETA